MVILALTAAQASAAPRSPRAYAHALTIARWHSDAEWQALDRIVSAESRWDPCAVYPGRHDCGYVGSNSCGIPQASPCPSSWRGQLSGTARAQVRWLVAYVAGRYGTPVAALAFRNGHGWF